MENNLRDSFNIAKTKFMYLEKPFYKDEPLFERYNEMMKERFEEGIIQLCDNNRFNRYTMSHGEIIKEPSHSCKTHVEFDSSSKQTSNYWLNECLLLGENLNADLLDVILKFREYK